MSDSGAAAASSRAFSARSSPADSAPILLGHSPEFSRLREQQIGRLADDEGPVLLSGEAGTGRAVLARAIHRASRRSAEPFVVVSCADVPETLLEIEIFGCLKGAAVGATSDRHGVLDMAHGGSVYLENIDEMSPRTQSLLVDFLESGDVRKIGAFFSGSPADVRVLASVTTPGSNGGRGSARRQGQALSPTLRAQFTGAELTVPALRDRHGDVPVLADYFARLAAANLGLPVTTFSPQAYAALESYSWPGNVGELKRVVDRVVREARWGEIRAEDLPVGIRPRLLLAARTGQGRRSVVDDLFRRLTSGGENFWTCVYPLFMRREITRMDMRELMKRGLDTVGGHREALVLLFSMPPGDEKRFYRFLQKYDCLTMTDGSASVARPAR